MIKEITVYETTDGTRFDNYERAEEYQFKLDWSYVTEDDVVLKDAPGNKASFEHWLNNFDRAFFVDIKTPFGKRFIDRCAERCGVDTIEHLGRYRWDECIEEWISFEEDFKRFNEEWDKFTKS